jgi:hypothetical protein
MQHQVFSLFHDIVFMYPGGHMVYFGPVGLVDNYFRQLTFTVPRAENPADFYIDVISDIIPHSNNQFWKAADLVSLNIHHYDDILVIKNTLEIKKLRTHRGNLDGSLDPI